MKYNKILAMLLLTSTVSATTTTLVSLNTTQTAEMTKLTSGQVIPAIYDVFHNSMGGFFWVFALAFLFIAIWLRTQNFTFPTLVIDVIWFFTGSNQVPELNYLVYGINILVIGGKLFSMYMQRGDW